MTPTDEVWHATPTLIARAPRRVRVRRMLDRMALSVWSAVAVMAVTWGILVVWEWIR